jgi:hypothetical protein
LFERELTRERVMAGLAAARARGRQGGRKSAFTKAALRRAQAAMQNRDTSIAQLCAELSVTKPTLYRNLTPTGELTEAGKRVLDGTSEKKTRVKQRAVKSRGAQDHYMYLARSFPRPNSGPEVKLSEKSTPGHCSLRVRLSPPHNDAW